MQKEFLTSKEACEFIGVKLSYLYKLTHRKQIPYFKPNGKKVFFKVEDLISWVSSVRISTAEEISEQASNYMISRSQ